MVLVRFHDSFGDLTWILGCLVIAACGGRSKLLLENDAAYTGHAGSTAQGGTSGLATGGSLVPGASGGSGSGGAPSTAAGGTPSCGDGSCNLAETTTTCAADCTGTCMAPADLTPWVNGPPFVYSGYATMNAVQLFCEPGGVDGAEVAFYVEMPSAGRLTASTVSSLTNFDTVLALSQGDCFGRNIECSDDVDGTAQSRATAWYDANELAIIVIESYEGIMGQFALTLEFQPDNFGYQWSGSAVGTLGSCSTASRDVWGIDLVDGERVNVAVDTVDASSAADFSLSVINLTEQRVSDAPFVFPCSHAAPAQDCPMHEFEAATSGPYAFTVGLATSACGSSLPTYQLRVQRQGGVVSLRLLEDG